MKALNQLTTGDFTEVDEPWALFRSWMEEAEASEPNDPTPWRSRPSIPTGCRTFAMVLLKASTRTASSSTPTPNRTRAASCSASPKAALVLHWKSLRRQVRARGPSRSVSDAEADAYFQSRPRDSRIGAWASQQSRPLESRFALEKAVALTRREICDRRSAAPALLDGLSHRARLDRVLAGPPVPAPRSGRLHPRG